MSRNPDATSPEMDALLNFLPCPTPESWFVQAREKLPLLLLDHANCEKKAAATAMNLMFRYTRHNELLVKMSQLAREELLHFQQVLELMEKHGIRYERLAPSRYAAGLHGHIRAGNYLQALVDHLIIGAFVEARSCERFAGLASLLESDVGASAQAEFCEDLCRFYRVLLRSETRHFKDYLDLAGMYAEEDLAPRIACFAAEERTLVLNSDEQLRFHSGVPVQALDPGVNHTTPA
ncbi:MAG: tRNA-(ms[2]io[6]A)-hydroxylase [Pseudohongiellaceae bacterium]